MKRIINNFKCKTYTYTHTHTVKPQAENLYKKAKKKKKTSKRKHFPEKKKFHIEGFACSGCKRKSDRIKN